MDSVGPKHMNMQLTRSKFEALVRSLVQRTVQPCKRAIKDADVSMTDISDVLLVGGMSRMPKVRPRVQLWLSCQLCGFLFVHMCSCGCHANHAVWFDLCERFG